MPLHVLPSGELLATDFTGVGPLAGVGAHVPLQDALVHSRETAVGALELFTDHREVIHWKNREGGREKKKKMRLALNVARLNKPRRHFSVITFN